MLSTFSPVKCRRLVVFKFTFILQSRHFREKWIEIGRERGLTVDEQVRFASHGEYDEFIVQIARDLLYPMSHGLKGFRVSQVEQDENTFPSIKDARAVRMATALLL